MLAHHWEEAGDLEQAVRWHRRAAEYVGPRDPIEGLRHWRQVREFGRALDTVIARHDALRASFNPGGEYQELARELKLDLGDIAEAERYFALTQEVLRPHDGLNPEALAVPPFLTGPGEEVVHVHE